MLGLLGELGLEYEEQVTAASVHASFAVQETGAYLDALLAGQRAAARVSVAPFLRPRSIAVVGASDTPGSIGALLLANLLANGFTGPVYPVNPRHQVIQGVPAYPDLSSCPGPPDLARLFTDLAHLPPGRPVRWPSRGPARRRGSSPSRRMRRDGSSVWRGMSARPQTRPGPWCLSVVAVPAPLVAGVVDQARPGSGRTLGASRNNSAGLHHRGHGWPCGSVRFTGEVRAVPEGRVVFAGEPLLEVTAPVAGAQLAETVLLNHVAFQTAVATKAARCVLAARGAQLVDFSFRRTQGIDASMAAARASAIAGSRPSATWPRRAATRWPPRAP